MTAVVSVASFATCLLARPAVASASEARAVAARVHVDAPPGCASDASFWRATSRRTDRLRAAGEGEAEASLEVIIRPAERGASGELRIVRGGKTSSQRTLRGASCEEVTQGLSLIAALAFDPAARGDMSEESARALATLSPTSGPPTSGPPTSGPPTDGPPGPGAVVPSLLAAPASAERPATAQRGNDPSAPWRFGGGVHGGALGLAAPDAALAYGAFLELERDAPGLSPSLRLGAMRAVGSASSAGVDAELSWILARVSVCPARLDLAWALALRPCAGVDAGSMSGRALRVAHAQDRSRPWVAPTATARLAWSPARLAFVEIDAGVAIPLVRDEVVVDPSVPLYRAPTAAPIVQIAAGLRFP